MKLIELFKKEYLLFKRNKKQLITVILLPFFFSILYLFMFSSSNINLDITVCNLDSGIYSNGLINALGSSFKTNIFSGNNVSECVNTIRSDVLKGTKMGIIIQDSFSEDILNYNQPTLHLYFDNSKPNLGFFAQSYLMSHITGFNSDILREAEQNIKDTTNDIESDLRSTIELLEIMNYSIPEAIQPSYNDLYNSISTYYNKISELNKIDLEFLVNPVNTELIGVFQGDNSDGFSFSVLYTVLNVLVILLLSSVSMVYDKNNGFLLRLKTSTTPIFYYILSKLLFFSLIGLLIFVPSFLIFLLNNAYFNINIITLIISICLTSMISTLLGCIIGLSSRNSSSSTMISIFLGFMFLLLSGLFYPVDLLPSVIKGLTLIIPTSFQTNLLNNALIFNSSLEVAMSIINTLLIYFGSFLFLTYYLIVKN